MCSRFPRTPQSSSTTRSNSPGGFWQRLSAIVARLQATYSCASQPAYSVAPIKIPTRRQIATIQDQQRQAIV
jgi:hypothetical protein